MKNIVIVLVALALIGVFSYPSWAQPDPEPEPEPETTEPAAISATSAAQAAGEQDTQAAAASAEQEAATGGACRVQNVSISDTDQVEVGYGCFSGATQISSNILVDRDNNGFVDTFNDGSGAGQTKFTLLPVEKKSFAWSQYNLAMLRLNQTVQAIAIARGTNLLGKEKCNQFTTDKGEKYVVWAVFGRSKKYQPVLLGYKVKQTINNNTVTLDISAGSLYNPVFAGINRIIHSIGCPLSEWIIVPDSAS